MKTIYFECNMGAAGDMFMAALLELHPDPARFIHRLGSLGIPGVTVSAAACVKCGVTGSQVKVLWDGREEMSRDYRPDAPGEEGHGHAHGHGRTQSLARMHGHAHHMGLGDIEQLLDALPLSPAVRRDAGAVYRLIAQAESHVHGRPVDNIHFHELGTMDAVADIVGSCMLMEELAPEQVLASPVHVGGGHVHCAHGILPVPAPATAHLLRDIPVYGGTVQGELCTPTGAALLRHFVSGFGAMPVMKVSGIGYGMGAKDFEVLSCLRAFLGESLPAAEPAVAPMIQAASS